MSYDHRPNRTVADFIVYKVGSLCKGLSNDTGRVRFSSTDDATVINQCIEALYAPQTEVRSGSVCLKDDLYLIGTTIRIYGNTHLYMDKLPWRAGIFGLKAAAGLNDSVIDYKPTTREHCYFALLEDLAIDGSRATQASGNGITSTANTKKARDLHMRDVLVYGCKENGVLFNNTHHYQIVNSMFEGCDGDGFRALDDGNAMLISNCYSKQNGGSGFYIANRGSIVSGCYASDNGGNGFEMRVTGYVSAISGCGAQNNSGSGFWLGEGRCFCSGYSTGNTQHGFDIQGQNNTVIGMATGNGLYGYNIAGWRNVVITNNHASELNTSGLYNWTHSRNNTVNNVAEESANAEEPQLVYPVGAIVDFTDSDDGSGDGLYILDTGGNWVKIN